MGKGKWHKGGKRWKGKDGVTEKELGNMLWVGKGVRVKGREKGERVRMGKKLREGNRGRWGKGEWVREGKG